MDDKDINYFEPNTPLVLKEELNIPLILKDEINLSAINDKNNEILKIKNLIKRKYLLTEKTKSDEINYHLDKDFNYIKNTAKEINNDIRKKTLKINKDLKSLNDEKTLLNQNRFELDQSKHKIQYEIIKKQQELIESNKKDNKEIKFKLLKIEKKLEEKIKTNKSLETNNKETTQTNRSLEINNNELKNTVGRYISNSKKLQNEINDLKSGHSENLAHNKKINLINQKIKFFQEENVRLSGELVVAQEKHDAIRQNFTNVEKEKNKISQRIQDLNESIKETNSNIVDTNFLDEFPEDELDEDLSEVNDSKKEIIDKEVNKIFTN